MKKNQDEPLISKLESLGLTKKAAQIYAVLLALGGAYPSKISEQTKLNRTTVYRLLLELSIKGLITEIQKKNKLFYQAERPQKFLQFTKQQIYIAEERYEKAKAFIPELDGLFSLIPERPKVRYFEGVDGVMDVYRDHVDTDKPYEMLGFSNTKELRDFLPAKFLAEYVKKKHAAKIVSRGIFPDTEKDKVYTEEVYGRVHKKIHPELRFIPASQYPYKSEITIYGKNKISIINFHEHFLVAVIIEDQIIYNMMRMIFELAWKGAET